MSRLAYWALAVTLGLLVGYTVASFAKHIDGGGGGAPDEWEKIRGGSLTVDTWVREIETDRLVCAVARRSWSVSISCVPKIPGLFEEPGR